MLTFGSTEWHAHLPAAPKAERTNGAGLNAPANGSGIEFIN